MKKFFSVLLVLILLLTFGACSQPTAVESPESNTETEVLYTKADREKQIEEAAAAYEHLLTADAIESAVTEHRTNIQWDAYKADPAAAANDLHRELTERLYLRSAGSLIAPVAPSTLEEAKRMIHEEFGEQVTQEYYDLVDTVLESGAAAGRQDNVPYEDAPQESFDGARKILLTQALGWIKE